jgi:lipopolysaccharide heptosyltransferase II
MPPGLRHQERHSGHAARRGDDRALKILLVRPRLIGDVVFTTPLLAGLKRAFPEALLYYAVEPAAAPVIRNNPHLHTIIPIPRRRGWRRLADDLALARRLRRERFDVAIDLHGGPRSAWLTWASRAPMRVGYRIPGRTWMYTHRVVRSPEPSVRHSVLNQWDLLAPLGIPGPPAADDYPVEMPALADAEARATTRLQELGIPPDAPLVLVHVSASNPFKRWPAGAFTDVVVHLARTRPAIAVAIVSGPSEPGAAEAIARDARGRLGAAGRRVVAPQVDLAEFRALAGRSAVYIGGDSGPLHVAATTGAPIVQLLGPTLATRSHPWRSGRIFSEMVEAGPLPCRPCSERVCAPGDFRCLARITPDQVIAAAERALAADRTSSG